ncbi:iron uptake transporter deferrochelatase/peroxidase subunit [Streptomyces klenkii]|uniref:iron uptake transporter deferrochelatase/peroxidase subunit n=1 Tax=Streptomyces klenkii TaxID=1420899 RepID=UPI0034291BF7
MADYAAMSRRQLIKAAGAAGAAGAVTGALAVPFASQLTGSEDGSSRPGLASIGETAIPFHGKWQPGIVTPAQAHGHLVAFDLAAGAKREDAVALMRRWSAMAKTIMAGKTPDHGTGIALDAGPSALTITFGFGRTFFDRVGLSDRRPSALDPLPAFPADAIDLRRSHGDLWVQIGAHDSLVAFHALRAMQQAAGTTARLRWQMNGFNRTPGATPHPMTPRNLMGHRDGTNNPKPDDTEFTRRVFVPLEGSPPWMANGSYAVIRRIRILLDDWDRVTPANQDRVIGRRKSDGAPLSGGTESTPMDPGKRDAHGNLVIPSNAHARIASPQANRGAAMLRRCFAYHDGFDADGSIDAGMLFIAWQADPLKGFVPVQRKLTGGDALSAFIRHESTALFAVPGGARPGEYVGQRLLEG